MPLGDIIFCKKIKGRKLPYPVPFLQDGDVCIATEFNLKLNGHVVGSHRVNEMKMYRCPYREYQ